jgi:hypothetical protein
MDYSKLSGSPRLFIVFSKILANNSGSRARYERRRVCQCLLSGSSLLPSRVHSFVRGPTSLAVCVSSSFSLFSLCSSGHVRPPSSRASQHHIPWISATPPTCAPPLNQNLLSLTYSPRMSAFVCRPSRQMSSPFWLSRSPGEEVVTDILTDLVCEQTCMVSWHEPDFIQPLINNGACQFKLHVPLEQHSRLC